MFDADVDPMFDKARAVDEDKEWRLVKKNKLWFEETVAGWNEDKQIIERGGDGTPRSRWRRTRAWTRAWTCADRNWTHSTT